ncbi:unnamed protein product [Spirodela intermedia]|uniref:Uncharacterized protein n=1 Tax=Spirodela intermedia TaxID=51605 RepID=A0A7I8J7N5_SPIIN|nr:unnamed protein product [Spirodela intermedia]CAA6665423.1 unnamed protein product [Spirodela intermedia]
MQAHKLHLRHKRCSFSPFAGSPLSAVSSLLVEPFSRSLALKLSDSSFLLYPPVPVPFSPTTFPLPTTISPISTSACFIRLLRSPGSDIGRVLFLSASSQGASVLLRGWFLLGGSGNGGEGFIPVQLSSRKDRMKSELVLDHRHGFSVTLAGSVNVFVLHSPAEGKILVYAARLCGEVGEEFWVDLMKCAVIECTSPVFSIQLSTGFLLLGEVAGVRVFPLRPLVKGRAGSRKNSRPRRKEDMIESFNRGLIEFRGKNLPNGVVTGVVAGKNGPCQASIFPSESTASLCNSEDGHSVEKRHDAALDYPLTGKVEPEKASAKLRTVKLRQNSGELSSYFVAFDNAEVQSPEKVSLSRLPVKTTSIHVLPQRKFLVLDSIGDLHLLSLSSKESYIVRLDCTIKVQMLAACPDLSTRGQIVWISDSLYSVHVIKLMDVGENDEKTGKKLAQVSAIRAIFSSERIQDIVPLTENAVMILEEGDIYVYEID